MSSEPIKDAPAFDFYPERWLAGVAEFSDQDQLVYLRLLCHAWLRDGLPADDDALKRLAGRKVSPVVLAKFPIGEDGVRRNGMQERIRDEQRKRIAKRREGANKTNSKRWGKDVASESLSDHSATPERVDIESPPPTTHHPPHDKDLSARGVPTIEQVKQWAESIMAPSDCAEVWWNEMEGAGWVDARGRPVIQPRPAFTAYATKWKANDYRSKSNAHKPPTPPTSGTSGANKPGRYSR